MTANVRVFRIFRGLLLALVVGLFLYAVQSPYYLRAPGRATDAATMVSVDPGSRHLAQGRFLVTTVFYDRATLLFCVYAMMDPMAELVPLKEGEEEAASDPEDQMFESKILSQLVAFRALGYDLRPIPVGVRVLQVFPDMPASGKLTTGDVLISVNGQTISDTREMVGLIQDTHGPIQLGLRRGTERIELEMVPTVNEGRKIVGVQIRDEFELPKFPVPVTIEQGNVSGASAGLIFALEIINQLTPDDLTGGRIVAGTGTVTPKGEVGPVKGVELKLEAARRAGAQVFLCPAENYADLKAVLSPGVEIISVGSVEEALEKLRQ